MKHMKHLCLLPGFVLLPVAVWASQPVPASMTISGYIDIAPDGSVTGYQLDRSSRIPPGAKAEVAKAVPRWLFQPVRVDGKAVPAKSAMHLRLVAKPGDKGSYTISVESAWFTSKHAVNQSDTLRAKQRKPPSYPPAAIAQRAQGTVYVVLRVNRHGKVDKQAIQTVNLRTRGTHLQMMHWRQMLARASKKATKNWTFTPPTTGPKAKQGHWVTVVPITYQLTHNFTDLKRYQARLYGKWQAYLPGPKHSISWLKDTQKALVANADALPGNGMFPISQTLHLRTSLSHGG